MKKATRGIKSKERQCRKDKPAMSILAQEGHLFSEWRSVRPTQQFVLDGVANEALFGKIPGKPDCRIVFLLKEANDEREHSDLDLRELMREGYRWQTWNNVVRWTRAIAECPERSFRMDLDTIGRVDRQEWLSRIAAMNLKKVPGGATCDYAALEEVALEDAPLLRRQLALYSPDVVVCCGTWWLASRVFDIAGEPSPVPGGDKRFRALREGGRIYVDCPHPGLRESKQALFEAFAAAIGTVMA